MARKARVKPKKSGKDKRSRLKKPKKCAFCVEKKDIDYKDFGVIGRYLTKQGRLFSRKRSGNCARHQRVLANAVKRARFMALLPYTMIGKGVLTKR